MMIGRLYSIIYELKSANILLLALFCYEWKGVNIKWH